MRRWTAVLLAAVVGLTVLAGCSSGDGDDQANDDAAATTEATDTTETTETSTSTAESTASSGDGADGEDPDGDSGEAFCARLAETGEGEEIDLDTAEGMAAFQELVDAAPPELQEPMQIIDAAFESVSGLDPDDPNSFGAFLEAFLNPEVLGSFEVVEAWGVDHCDLPEDFLEGDADDGVADLSGAPYGELEGAPEGG